MSLQIVKVLYGFEKWNAGEICGFAPEKAQELFKRGLAEPYTPTAEEINPQPRVRVEELLQIVRFIKGWTRYYQGELAGFTPDVATRLMAQGIAVPHEPEAEAEPAPTGVSDE